MKVLYILRQFPNISNTFIISEIAQLLRSGHEVDIVSHGRPRDIDITAHRAIAKYGLMERTTYVSRTMVARHAAASPSALSGSGIYKELWGESDAKKRALTAALARIMKKGGYDAVHTHFAGDQCRSALAAARVAGVPFTFTTHAFDLYDREEKFPDDDLRVLLEHSLAAVTISEYNRRNMVKVCGPSSRNKVKVVHCGIEPDDFDPVYDRKSKTVLTVGRLVEKKGIRDLLDAFGQLRERKRIGNLRLTIAGGGPLEDELKERCRSLDLDDVATFRGFLEDDEIEELFRDTAIFVLPCVEAGSGDIDGIPVTLMESMAREVPVISTGVSGIPELIEDGRSGLLVPPGDPGALAQAIRRFTKETGLARRLGGEGRRKVLRDFNIRRTVAGLVKVWEGGMKG